MLKSTFIAIGYIGACVALGLVSAHVVAQDCAWMSGC